MKNVLAVLLSISASFALQAQKKPLVHSVYDGWKSAGERNISNDGKYVFYTINPQEGDGVLFVQGLDNSFRKEIPRGYLAKFTEDNRFVIFKIRPYFKDTRDARIKKKRPDEMPKDSMGIIELGKDTLIKIGRVKSFKVPEKGTGQWMAYHKEKSLPDTPKDKTLPDSLTQINNLARLADSLVRMADSIRNKANEAKLKGLTVLQTSGRENKAPASKTPAEPVEEGTELIIRNMNNGEEIKFKWVNEYYFSQQGNVLLAETSKKNNDSLIQASLLWMNTGTGKTDTIFRKFNDAKNYAMDEAGTQLAFVAERDSALKALTKFYKLYYYKPGIDSAQLRGDRNSPGIPTGFTISPDYNNQFSKDGKKLFLGFAPVRKPKDTTLVDFETARLDIWHYNDDYLQPQQLVNAAQELRRSYLAVLNEGDSKFITLGMEDAENVQLIDEGNANYVLATSTKGNRVAAQWEGYARQNAYLVSTLDGTRKKVSDKIRGFFSASPKGNFVVWYDWKARHYFTYNVAHRCH